MERLRIVLLGPSPHRPLAGCLAALLALAGGLPASGACFDSIGKPIRSSGTNGVESVFAIDVDGDDDLDVLSASFGDDRIAWHENDGGAPPSFSEHTISASVDSALAVFGADMDGDGDADVLSASSGDDTIRWFVNNGASSPVFLERIVARQVDGATDVFAIDLDGDGDVDVLSGSFEDDTIAWYENDGAASPSFVEHAVTTTADGAASVFAADLDGDMDVDILSASRLDDTIAWYERGATVRPVAVSTTSYSSASSGFKDSMIDGAGLSGPGRVETWLHDDNPTADTMWHAGPTDGGLGGPTGAPPAVDGQAAVFDLGQTVAVEGAYVWNYNQSTETGRGVDELEILVSSDPFPLTAEFTSLGIFNLSEACGCPTEPAQFVPFVADNVRLVKFEIHTAHSGLASDSVGLSEVRFRTEWSTRKITTTAKGATSVFAADFDGDGDLDVVSASSGDDKIAWYENDGAAPPDFIKRAISTSTGGARAVHAADLDGDNDVDILASAGFDDEIVWFENDGAPLPGFTERLVSDQLASPDGVIAADVDGNGFVDVVAASSIPGSPARKDRVTWFSNNGSAPPVLTAAPIARGAIAPSDVLVVDLDGDGDDDALVTSIDDDMVTWFENDGAAEPSFVEREIDGAAPGAAAVDAADIDGDGDTDVVAASELDNTIAWYASDGSLPPSFVKRIVTSNAEGASAVFAVDFDGDLDTDVVSASRRDDTIAWHENDGADPPVFTEHVVSDSAVDARSVFAVDLDDDGDVDVLSASAGDNQITWHENDGADPPAFSSRVITNLAASARSVWAADLDGDGDVDVLSASAADDTIAWYQQGLEEGEDPEIVFTRLVITRFADLASRVSAVDFDSDGDLDVLAAATGDDLIAWYENSPQTDAPPTFTERLVSTRVNDVRAVSVGDVNGDESLDVVSAYLFQVAWHAGGVEETCGAFDATGDGRIDGLELVWLGAAFAEICADPGDPSAEWWDGIDFSDDCLIDGDDLSILTSRGVWGKAVDECSFTCQDVTPAAEP